MITEHVGSDQLAHCFVDRLSLRHEHISHNPSSISKSLFVPHCREAEGGNVELEFRPSRKVPGAYGGVAYFGTPPPSWRCVAGCPSLMLFTATYSKLTIYKHDQRRILHTCHDLQGCLSAENSLELTGGYLRRRVIPGTLNMKSSRKHANCHRS